MKKYFEELSKYDPLDPQEELEIAKKAKAGDANAKEKLIKHNLRYVVEVAKSYQGQGLPLEELIAEGNYGLCKAAEKFNPDYKMKFITYAVWWIRQSILRALSENTRLVRLPINKINDIQKYRKEQEKAYQETGHFEDINPALERYSDHYSASPLSLNAPVNNKQLFIELLPDKKVEKADEQFDKDSLYVDLKEVLGTLSKREEQILKLYHGLDEFRAYTLEEIGKMFNLTRERIRQIKRKSLKFLRRQKDIDKLRYYL